MCSKCSKCTQKQCSKCTQSVPSLTLSHFPSNNTGSMSLSPQSSNCTQTMPPIGPLMFLIPIKPSIFLLAQLDGQTNIHAEQSLQWFSIVLSLPGLLKYDKLWRSSSNRNYPREMRLVRVRILLDIFCFVCM